MTIKQQILAGQVLCAFLLASPIAFGHSAQSGAISIGHLWARPQKVAASSYGSSSSQAIDIYGPFFNAGETADALIGVTSASSSSVKIVRWVRGNQFTGDLPLPLPPGKPVALGPETQFLRLSGAQGALSAGAHIPVTFHFQHAPQATLEVVIETKEAE